MNLAQALTGMKIDAEKLQAMISKGPAFAGRCDGQIIGFAGLAEEWPGRYIAWAALSALAARHMYAITRTAERFLKLFNKDRVEAYVHSRHTAGQKWVELLGFKPEGFMKNFYEGQTFILYARCG